MAHDKVNNAIEPTIENSMRRHKRKLNRWRFFHFDSRLTATRITHNHNSVEMSFVSPCNTPSKRPSQPRPTVQAIPRLPFWSTKRTEEDEDGPSKDAQRKVLPNDQPEDDIDAPPSFPMLDSAQRSQAPKLSVQPHSPEVDFDVVPPSPSTSSDRTASPPTRHQTLPAATTSLQTPPTTTKKPNPAIKKRQKVALAPGCSPLDWARVKSSGDPKLRAGHMMPIRVTLDELKKVCRRDRKTTILFDVTRPMIHAFS